MDLVKGNRSAFRSQATKLMKQFDELNDSPDANIQLRSLTLQLEEKRTELKLMDNEILALNTNVEANLEEEIDTAQRYQKNILETLEKIKNKLQQTEKNKLDDSKEKETSTKMMMTAKLPKIDLPTFSGDITQFDAFYQLYDATINKRKDLAAIEKSAYLVSLMRGEAAKVLSGFALTEENYEDMIKTLQEKYSNKERMKELYVTKILNLRPMKDISNLNTLKELITELNINIRNLENLGIKTNECSPILITKVKQLLPTDILLEYEKNRGTERSLDQFMKFVQAEIQHRVNITPTTYLNPNAVPFRPKFDAPVWRPNSRAPFIAPRNGQFRTGLPRSGQQWGPRIPFRPGPRFSNPPVPPPGTRTVRPVTQPAPGTYKCYRCGRPGHVARDCRAN